MIMILTCDSILDLILSTSKILFFPLSENSYKKRNWKQELFLRLNIYDNIQLLIDLILKKKIFLLIDIAEICLKNLFYSLFYWPLANILQCFMLESLSAQNYY